MRVSGAVIAVDAFAAGAQPKPVTATSQICLWKEKETQFLSLCRYAKTASDVCHFSRKKDKKKTEQQSGKHSSQEATTTETYFFEQLTPFYSPSSFFPNKCAKKNMWSHLLLLPHLGRYGYVECDASETIFKSKMLGKIG